MLESIRVEKLTAEWKKHESRIVEIKAEIAALLGFSAGNDSSSEIPDVDPSEVVEIDSTVAPGTKGRLVLEAIQTLGGKTKAGPVKLVLIKGGTLADEPRSIKTVRGYFNHLRKKGYISSVKGHRGTWALTPKATAVLGGAP